MTEDEDDGEDEEQKPVANAEARTAAARDKANQQHHFPNYAPEAISAAVGTSAPATGAGCGGRAPMVDRLDKGDKNASHHACREDNDRNTRDKVSSSEGRAEDTVSAASGSYHQMPVARRPTWADTVDSEPDELAPSSVEEEITPEMAQLIHEQLSRMSHEIEELQQQQWSPQWPRWKQRRHAWRW